MADIASLLILGLRAGATPLMVRKAYIALSLRHHPDRGGDTQLFQRVAGAYSRLNGRGSGGGESAEELLRRVTREEAPSSWATRRESTEDGGVLRLEANPQLEAAFRYAGAARKHTDVLNDRAFRGYTFDATGAQCGPACLTHVTASKTSKAVACSSHKRAHACAPGVCCSDERACPMTILALANQWRARAAGVLSGAALEAHRCTPGACTWTELPSLRFPKAPAAPTRRIYVCATTGRPHICTPAQCRAGREQRVVDEQGALARQWRCGISQMPLGPLMPWTDGTTLQLGTGETMRLGGPTRGGGGGREHGSGKRSRGGRDEAGARSVHPRR